MAKNDEFSAFPTMFKMLYEKAASSSSRTNRQTNKQYNVDNIQKREL